MNYTITKKVKANYARQRKLDRNMEIVKLYDEGNMSMREIGEKFGITNARVSYLYHKYSAINPYEHEMNVGNENTEGEID